MARDIGVPERTLRRAVPRRPRNSIHHAQLGVSSTPKAMNDGLEGVRLRGTGLGQGHPLTVGTGASGEESPLGETSMDAGPGLAGS